MAETIKANQQYRTEVRYGASSSDRTEFPSLPRDDSASPEYENFVALAQTLVRVPKSETDEKRKG